MRYTICAILVAASVARVAAAELSVLATAAAQGPVQALDKALQQPDRATKVQFDTSPNIAKRLAAGETPDVLIAQAAAIDQLIKEGRALAATRTPVGRIGVGVGITSALLATRLLQTLLFETPAASPVIYLGIAGLLAATATLASWFPARRAAAVDPLIAIRDQ
jgi:hypothetical protein